MADNRTPSPGFVEEIERALGTTTPAPEPAEPDLDAIRQTWSQTRQKATGLPAPTEPAPDVGTSPLARDLEDEGWLDQRRAEHAADRERTRQTAIRRSQERAADVAMPSVSDDPLSIDLLPPPGPTVRPGQRGALEEAGRGIAQVGMHLPGSVVVGVGSIAQAGSALGASAELQQQAERAWKLSAMDSIDAGKAVPFTRTGDAIRDGDRFYFMQTYRRASQQERDEARGRIEAEFNAFNPTPVSERPLYRAGETAQEVGRKLPTYVGLPQNIEGYDETSFATQLSRGLGSMITGLVASAATGPAGGVAVFGSMGISEATQRAVEFDRRERAAGRKGLTQEQIVLAGLWGVGPGTTDVLPVEALLGRLPLPIPRALRGALARSIAAVGGQSIIEGVQEGGQQFLHNLISWQVYNPNQVLTQDVLDNGLLGMAVGIVGSGGMQAARGLLGRQPEAPIAANGIGRSADAVFCEEGCR